MGKSFLLPGNVSILNCRNKELMNADEEELKSLNGIGPVTAENIKNYFKNDENLNILKSLQQSGIKGIDL